MAESSFIDLIARLKDEREVVGRAELIAVLSAAETDIDRWKSAFAQECTKLVDADAEIARLKEGCARQNEEVCQSLGKALGYPWFKDDQKNFPGAGDEHGVCVGEHVAESIAEEAAKRLVKAEAALAEMRPIVEAALHLRITAREGRSEYIKENGRLGKSPWAEFCDACEPFLARHLSAPAPGPAKEGEG